MKPIRGNVENRIQKVYAGEYDAAILAVAGLQRLDIATVQGDRVLMQGRVSDLQGRTAINVEMYR